MAKVVADMEIGKVVMELPDTKTIRLLWPECYDIEFLTGQFITVSWPDTQAMLILTHSPKGLVNTTKLSVS